jgi:two-component system cell cycle sensor histidine kinase PleC
MSEAHITSGTHSEHGTTQATGTPVDAATPCAENRAQMIRLELYSAIMHTYRGLPLFFPVISAALALTLQSPYPGWVIALWWMVLAPIHGEYFFFQNRFFTASRNALPDAKPWIRGTARRYWVMNVVWLGLIPLFWNGGGDIQNFALLMIFVVHVVMASQTAHQIVPVLVSVTVPIMIAVVGLCLAQGQPVYLAIGIGCIPTYLYLLRIARHQRKAATETLDLRLRNAELIRDLGHARDISEAARQQAEEANSQLKRREHHFRALVENAFDVVLVTDENAIIQYASPAASKLGLPPESLIGRSCLDLVSPDERHRIIDAASTISGGGARMTSHELAIPRHDGQVIWIESTLTNLLDDENVRGFVVNIRNITERKRTEAEQRGQFQVLQALATGEPLSAVMMRIAVAAEETNPSARVAVFLLDADREFITCAAPNLPDDFHDLVSLFWRAQKKEAFGTATLAGTPVVVTDLQDERHGHKIASYMKDQGLHTLWFQPIAGHDGRVIGAVALYFPSRRTPDEWEWDYLLGMAHLASIAIGRRRSDEHLRHATEAAELANRAKTKFLANMSHELRTPLNAIIGFSEIMRQEMFGPIGSERYIEYTKDIHDSGRHLLSVIDDILDISKIEAGRYAIEEGEIDFRAVLHWSVEMMRARTSEKSQTVSLHLPDDMPDLRADQRAMRQVMLNLLSNAAKFTPVGGAITISVSLTATGDLSLSVNDTGIGIPSNKLREVLEPFGQVDDATSRQHGGTGLGLPITKSLIEMHGGEFHLESELGTGTTATMVMPNWRLVYNERMEKAATQGA